jgi:hypothetical protein
MTRCPRHCSPSTTKHHSVRRSTAAIPERQEIDNADQWGLAVVIRWTTSVLHGAIFTPVTAMTLYSYIVKHDTGFAPNPFFGFCTLACCKPEIRRHARKDDWIVGLTPKAQGNRIVYFMRVDETTDFYGYWDDARFRDKRPRHDKDVKRRCGDNIYQPLPDGGFRQLPSMHSDGADENPELKKHDLGGTNVLISETFTYFGSMPVTLPPELAELCVGRGHKCRFPESVKADFLRLAGKVGFGVHAPPLKWPNADTSWKPLACGR